MKTLILTLAAALVLLSPAVSDAQGVISGTLFKATGRVLPYTEIELVEVGAHRFSQNPRLLAVSATNGKFSFPNVPPGRYTLSINFGETPTDLSPYDTFFFPSATERFDAEVFDISKGERYEKLIFKLPPANQICDIKGVVVYADGRPATGVSLGLNHIGADFGVMLGEMKSDSNGAFTVHGFAGTKYRIAAIAFGRGTTREGWPTILSAGLTDVFTAAKNAKPMRIELTENPNLKEFDDFF